MNPPKYKIHKEKLIDVDSPLYKKLTSISLRGRGRMRKDASAARKSGDKNYYIFYAEENSKILGWCLINVERFCTFYVYVRNSHRRFGIGNALFGRANAFAKNLGKRLNVYPWNEAAREFFKNKDCLKNY